MSNKSAFPGTKTQPFRSVGHRIKRTVGPTLLRPDDVKHARSLARKLFQPTNSVAHYVEERLSEQAKSQLANWSAMLPEELQSLLIDELNRLIVETPLTDADKFAGVELSEQTQQLLAEQPTDDRRFRLNRLLLEDAFPNEIEFRPYIGPRPFARDDELVFYGRDHEVSDLVGLVTAHETLVVYAQSGAGKTSLINAALIPALEAEEFEVLPPARVRGSVTKQLNPDEITNIYVFNALVSWSDDGVDEATLQKQTLAEYLAGLERGLDQYDEPMARVVIFDQFEELFTFFAERWREREEFFDEVVEAMEADPSLRVLFVMREDYVANMDPYSNRFPDRLRIRYHLQRMRHEESLGAVRDPLRGSGRSFDEAAANQLVMELRQIRVEDAAGKAVVTMGEFVEPVQLQVVCQSLWDELPKETKLVTTDHVRESGNVDHALTAFYESAVKACVSNSGVSEGALRTWFEQELITPAGTRGTVYRGAKDTEGIANEAVDVLENLHLIRAEVRGGSRWYELTHDRFIAPIQKANDEWRQKYHIQELSALEGLTDWWRKFSRVASAFVVVLGMAAIVLAIVAMIGWRKANASRKKAEMAEDVARGAEREAKEAKDDAEELSSRFKRREGASYLERGDIAGGLLWFVNDLHDNKLSVLNRIRIGAALHQQPTLADVIHRDNPSAQVFSHQGQYLVVGYRGETDKEGNRTSEAGVELWNFETGADAEPIKLPLETSPKGEWSTVDCCAFSPDDRYLLVGTSRKRWDDKRKREVTTAGTAYVFTLQSGTPSILHKQPFDGSVGGATFAPRRQLPQDLKQKQILPRYVVGLLVGKKLGEEEITEACLWSWDEESIRNNPQPVTLVGSKGAHLVRFSREGKYVATDGEQEADHDVATDGEQERDHDVATDGEQEPDHYFAMWDVEQSLQASGEVQAQQEQSVARGAKATFRWPAGAASIRHFAFSPVEDLVVVTTGRKQGGMAFLLGWPAENQSPVDTPRALVDIRNRIYHRDEVRYASFSPDGRYVVTASDDHNAIVFDRQARNWYTLPHDGKVFQAEFSADGRYVATGCRDKRARVWDVAALDPRKTAEPIFSPLCHPGSVTSITFSPDTFRLLTHCEDTIRIWELETKNDLPRTLLPDGYLTGTVTDPAFNVVVTTSRRPGSLGSEVQVWNARDGKPLTRPLEHDRPVTATAIDDQQLHVATVTEKVTEKVTGHAVRLWNVADMTPLWKSDDILDQGLTVHTIAFSPDGQLVAAGCGNKDDGEIHLWNLEGKLPRTLKHDAAVTMPVTKLRFSEDGKHIVAVESLAKAAQVIMFDVATGKPVAGPFAHTEPVTDFVLDAENGLLLTACEDDRARVWDLKPPHGKPLRTLVERGEIRTHSADVNVAAFSPRNSRLVVTAGEDNEARIWELDEARTTAKLLEVLKHDGPVQHAAFSNPPLGGDTVDIPQLLLTASGRTVRVWDVENGELVASFAHQGSIAAVRFDRDNQGVYALTRHSHGPASDSLVVRTWKLLADERDSTVLGRVAEELASRRVNQDKIELAAIHPSHFNDIDLEGKLIDEHDRTPIRPAVGELGALHKQASWEALAQGNPNAAEWHLDRARASAPDDDELTELQARVKPAKLLYYESSGKTHLDRRDWENAIKAYEKSLALNSNRWQPHFGMAEVNARRKRWRLAEQQYTKALELSPENVTILTHRANARGRAGKWSEALEDYWKAISLDSARESLWMGIENIYRNGTRTAFRSSELLERALQDLPVAIEKYPQQMRPCFLLGHAYRDSATGQDDPSPAAELWQKAADMYTRALEFPNTTWILYWRAAAYFELGRKQEAVDDLKQYADYRSSGFSSYALALLATDQETVYRELCRQRLATDGRDWSTNNAIVWMCALKPNAVDDYKDAIDLARAAVAQNPQPGIMNTLGAILYRDEKYEEAVDQLNKALEKRAGTGYWNDWLFLAMAHHRLGNQEEAQKWFNKVSTESRDDRMWFVRFEKEMLFKEAQALIRPSTD